MSETSLRPARMLPGQGRLAIWVVVASIAVMTVGVFGPWEIGLFPTNGTTSPNLGWDVLAAAIVAGFFTVSYLVNGSRVNCVVLAVAAAAALTMSLYDEWRHGAGGTGWGLAIEIGGSLALLLMSIGLGLPARLVEPAVQVSGTATSVRTGSGRGGGQILVVVFTAALVQLGLSLLGWQWSDAVWIALGLIVGLGWLRPRTSRGRAAASMKWDGRHPELAARRAQLGRPPLSLRRFIRRIKDEADVSPNELRYAIAFADTVLNSELWTTGFRGRRALASLVVLMALTVFGYVIGVHDVSYAIALAALGRCLQVAYIRRIVPRRFARLREIAVARLGEDSGVA